MQRDLLVWLSRIYAWLFPFTAALVLALRFAANGALRPTEVILPETIAEYGYGWAAAPVIRIGNQASHSGVLPQGPEKSTADPDSIGRTHRPALGEIQLILVAPSERLGENVLVVTDVRRPADCAQPLDWNRHSQ